MQRHWRGGIAAVALCGVLLTSGCAAGSPAVVPVNETPAGAVLAARDAPTTPAPALAQVEPTATTPVIPAVKTPDSLAFAQDVPDVVATEPVQPPDETADNAVPQPDVVTQTDAVVDPATGQAPVVTETSADPASAETIIEDTAAAPADVAPPTDLGRPAAPGEDGSGMSQIIEGGTNGRLEVALTFDAGADTGYAPQILDYLRDEGIKATFGMTGQWAEQNPELVQRMVNEGHQLINHTWDHASLTGANTGMPPMTPDQVVQELSSTEDLVRNLTGYEMRPYFRPPYGDYDATSLGYLYENGYYLTIWWTCDSHGWAGWGSQEIIDYCTTNLAEDEILLLHVGAAAAGDFEALPGLIQFFRDNGYGFVTVEQMLQP
ncbi:MAG: polysaccharide deacetylase family protein [Chloroflexota bacterium]|nr:polysaccharide deacetylase family protein [Chloroflexota bacterium]